MDRSRFLEFLARVVQLVCEQCGMRVVLQRVSESEVRIAGAVSARIGTGLLVLLAIEEGDGPAEADWLANKIVSLRVFPDNAGVMNRSVLDVGGDLLLVSQFTLYASTRKGNRPSYIRAAKPEVAVPIYDSFHLKLEALLGRK